MAGQFVAAATTRIFCRRSAERAARAKSMRALPAHAKAYRRTPEFTETTVPLALLRRHDTKTGVWGRIRVLEGELLYRILEPELEEHRLRPGLDGIVEPCVPHEVEPQGPVRFFVEFLRESTADADER